MIVIKMESARRILFYAAFCCFAVLPFLYLPVAKMEAVEAANAVGSLVHTVLGGTSQSLEPEGRWPFVLFITFFLAGLASIILAWVLPKRQKPG